MSTSNTAARILERLLTNGALKSQYEWYINSQIRKGDSWYMHLLAKEGRKAAEAALDEWNQSSRMSDFAKGIELVARGMLALAKIDVKGEHTRVVEVTEQVFFPRCFGKCGKSEIVVVFNRQAPGCGCAAPAGSEDWAPYGRLGLRAVTLQADWDLNDTGHAQLGLVLPQRALCDGDSSKDGFTVATIDLEGHTDGHTYSTKGFYRDGYLMFSLGLIELKRAINGCRSGGGHFDDAVGFPGATQYLANGLPKLGEYLTSLAEKLTGHDH